MRTAELQELSGLPEKELRQFGRVLPLTSVGQERSRRFWPLGDQVAILVASRLLERGFKTPAALGIVAAMLPHFIDLVATDGHAWALVRSDDSSEFGFAIDIIDDAERGFELITECPDATLLSIHALVRAALVTIACAKIGESPR